MAKITITIPDGEVANVVNAACEELGYQTEIKNKDGLFVPNPETKLQFANRAPGRWLKALVLRNKKREVYKEADRALTEVNII